MLIAVPFLFRRLSGVTVVVAGMLATAAWLNLGAGYLTITAFEIVAVGTVFIWLILFIRSVSAAVDGIPRIDRDHDQAAVTTGS